ncbi:MAG: methyl-accepting chemotaxis protein [Gallionella sp.]
MTVAGFVTLIATLLLVVGGSLSKLSDNAETIHDSTIPFLLTLGSMDLSRSEVQQFLTDVSATHDREAYVEADAAAQIFLSGVAKFKEYYTQKNDAEHLWAVEQIETSFKIFHGKGLLMAEAYITEGLDAGNRMMKGDEDIVGFDQGSIRVAEELFVFRKDLLESADAIAQSSADLANETMVKLQIGGVIAILLAIAMSTIMARSILRKLGGEPHEIAGILNQLADADLTVTIDTKGKDKGSVLFGVKVMVEKLTNIVSNVRRTTDSITIASKELAAGNTNLSQRTEEQASSLEETASSMEELTSAVRQNDDNARQANQLAHNASDVAIKGGKVVDDVVVTMASISASSNKIMDIISVIEGIAFQTNILALNAAVEAARAGEQGRGFAVVAGEVRSLAQRSAAAAKEITALIEESVEKVQSGSKQVDEAGATMSEIVLAVKRVTDIMSEISAASQEQGAGIEQVNQAIAHMDEGTQQNAALVEEASAAAEAMNAQATELYAAVSAFKLNAKKSAATARSAPPKPPRIKRKVTQAPPPIINTRKLAQKFKADENEDEWKEF